MENKNTKNRQYYFYLTLLTAVALLTTASLAFSFSQETEITEDTINTCVAKMFEFDREQIFSDVPIQQWYTHSANFLIILDPSFGAQTSETDETGTLPQFNPQSPITQVAFVDMVSKYQDVLPQSPRPFKAKKTKRKMSQKDIAYVLQKMLGLPAKTVSEIIRQEGIKSRTILRKEAAHILFKSVERMMAPQSVEKTLCEVKALEDPEEFISLFGPQETDSTLVIDSPPDNPATISPTTGIHPTTGIINLAPVNPRAGTKVKVTVTSEAGATLTLLKNAGGLDGASEYIPLEEKSNGIYEGEISSTWAGTYRISIMDGTSLVGTPRDIVFAPDFPSQITFDTITPQVQSTSKKEATVSVTLRDQFENIIPVNSNELRITTDLGRIKKIEKSGAAVLATVETTGWGVATIQASHLNRSAVQDAAGKTEIPFSSVMLDIPKGIESGKPLSVPVYLYMPQEKGQIAGYKIKLAFEKEHFALQNITDLDSSDGFDAAAFTTTDEGLLLQQQTTTKPAKEIVAVGTLNLVASNTVTSGTFFVPEARVISEHEKIISAQPPEDTVDRLVRWWYSIKPIKNVCLDIWLSEGSDTTRTEALDDAQQAANMYLRAANASFCPFFMNFDINFHTISRAQWNASVDAPGGTANRLDPGEAANLATNFSGNASCVQIWYVPDIAPKPDGTNIVGQSYPNNGGIAINNHRDGIDVAMAHEMNHQLSGNQVLDSPFDPANTQGAQDAKNSMNYNDLGFGLTKAQCELIKQKPYISYYSLQQDFPSPAVAGFAPSNAL